jgi:hypothetical protein
MARYFRNNSLICNQGAIVSPNTSICVNSHIPLNEVVEAYVVAIKPSRKTVRRRCRIGKCAVFWDTEDDLNEDGWYEVNFVIKMKNGNNYAVRDSFTIISDYQVEQEKKQKREREEKLKSEVKKAEDDIRDGKWDIKVWE